MEQLALREGATILDVGCGAGQDALDLAQAVGPHGRVIGIDSSERLSCEGDQLMLPIGDYASFAPQNAF